MDARKPECGVSVRAKAEIPYTDSAGVARVIPARSWGGLVKEHGPGKWYMTFWGLAVTIVPLSAVDLVPEAEEPPPYWEMHSQEEGWVPPAKKGV